MRRGAWSLRLNGCGTAATWRPVADITRAAAAASNTDLAVLAADQSKLATTKNPRLEPLIRVSFETSFDSKQPKVEPKLVSALSETKRLFWLFRFYTETEIFYVSMEPKQTEDQPKQVEREHIWVFL